MRLFIFGNGFDRAHNLPTAYCQFRQWLIEKYHINVDEEEIELPDFNTNYKGLEDYSEKSFAAFFVRLIDDAEPNSENEEKWCCFEENLAFLRWELVLNSINKEYDDEGDLDLWKTETNVSIQAKSCEESNHILRSFFMDWIMDINELIDEGGNNIVNPYFESLFKDSDKYLTFNYTNTLERLYKVKNVCHIHGNIAKWEEPIFGHCNPGYPKKDFNDYEYNAYEIFQRIYRGYIKDTNKQIVRNYEFFNSIKDVEEIYLFGLSFGDVDLPYFSYIFKKCHNAKVIYLNVYNPDEFDEKVDKLKSCGVKCKIIQWIC